MEDEKEDRKTVPSKKLIAAVVALVVVIAAGLGYWYDTCPVPYNEAVDKYNASVVGLGERNAELDAAIEGLQESMDSETAPLDAATMDAASGAVAQAQQARQEAPGLAGDTEEVLATADEIEKMGEYSVQLDGIAQAKDALEASIRQREQVTNPSEQFVIERLTGLPNITGVEAATETNDPNRQLNKQGGYTSDVFFSSDLVDQSQVFPMDGMTGLPAAGTDGGGCVEVYGTEEDAQSRDAYLGSFDGTVLSSGYHTVVGTCVVRVSTLLTAAQQQQIAQAVTASLTRLE